MKSVKEIILKLDDIEDWKREALLNKLSELEREVARDRFEFKIWGAFVVESAGVLGEAAKRLEPVRKFIDSVSGLLYGAKQNERQSLPPPQTPKQIEPPKTKAPPPPPRRTTRSEMDDDIPF